MTDMRSVIDIIDWGCDEERRIHDFFDEVLINLQKILLWYIRGPRNAGTPTIQREKIYTGNPKDFRYLQSSLKLEQISKISGKVFCLKIWLKIEPEILALVYGK